MPMHKPPSHRRRLFCEFDKSFKQSALNIAETSSLVSYDPAVKLAGSIG